MPQGTGRSRQRRMAAAEGGRLMADGGWILVAAGLGEHLIHRCGGPPSLHSTSRSSKIKDFGCFMHKGKAKGQMLGWQGISKEIK